MKLLRNGGVPWGKLNVIIRDYLPGEIAVENGMIVRLVAKAMTRIFGRQNVAWHASASSPKVVSVGKKTEMIE